MCRAKLMLKRLGKAATWGVTSYALSVGCAFSQSTQDAWYLGRVPVKAYASDRGAIEFLSKFFQITSILNENVLIPGKTNVLLYLGEGYIDEDQRLSDRFYDDLPDSVAGIWHNLRFRSDCNIREVTGANGQAVFLVVVDTTTAGKSGALKCALYAFHRVLFGAYSIDTKATSAEILLQIQERLVNARN